MFLELLHRNCHFFDIKRRQLPFGLNFGVITQLDYQFLVLLVVMNQLGNELVDLSNCAVPSVIAWSQNLSGAVAGFSTFVEFLADHALSEGVLVFMVLWLHLCVGSWNVWGYVLLLNLISLAKIPYRNSVLPFQIHFLQKVIQNFIIIALIMVKVNYKKQ